MTRDPKSDRLPSWIWLWGPLAIAVALAIVPHIDWEWYKVWIVSEQRGLLETAEFVVALAGFVVALGMFAMKELRRRTWLRLWVGVAALSLFYIAGEEISWGQNYLGWETPESWMSVNDQGETNLHNTSSWFDQKPRALLEFAVVVGGILLPLVALARPALRRARFGIAIPPLLCLPSAVIAEFARGSQRIVHLSSGSVHLFGRPSEVQELFFYLFALLYLIVLRRRLSASRSAQAGDSANSIVTPKASSGAR